jgi:hypothetical protein
MNVSNNSVFLLVDTVVGTLTAIESDGILSVDTNNVNNL